MRISDWSSDVCSSDLGRGTFVRRGAMSAPVEVPIYSMIEQISRIGATTEVRVLEFGDEVPSPEIRAAFGIGEGEALQRCVRSEERRVGKERVSTGRSRWSPYH